MPRRARAIALLVAMPLAVPLSGAVRYQTGASFFGSLLIAIVVCAAFALAVSPLVGAHDADSVLRPEALALALTGAGAACAVLYVSTFDGMPALTGGDGGNHLTLHEQFVETGRNPYNGMIALVATTHWLERVVGLDRFRAYRLALYAPVVANVAFLAVAASALRSRRTASTRRLRWLLMAAVGALGALAGTAVILPLHHYLMADGFFAQSFGLLPLFGAIAHYSLARRRLVRLIALGVWVVVLRYTYVLNAGDFILTAAILVGWEALKCGSRRARLALLGVSLVGLLVAVVVFAKLVEVFSTPGGIHPANTILAARGTLGLSALLVASPAVAGWAGAPFTERAARMLVASGLFGLCAGGGPLLWSAIGRPELYYFHKYGYCGAIVAGTASLALGGFLAVHLLRGLLRQRLFEQRILAMSGLLAGAGIAWFALVNAYATYQPSYRERVRGRPPFKYLTPLAVPGVWADISSTLRAEHARFGGFLSSRWPEESFTNGRFWNMENDRVSVGGVAHEPGFCAFWYAEAPSRPTSPEGSATVEYLEKLAGRSCSNVGSGAGARLCHLCPRLGSYVAREVPLDDPARAELTGFHHVEGSAARRFRWTAAARAQILVRDLELPSGSVCALLMKLGTRQASEVLLNGTTLARMGDGAYALPASVAGTKTDREITISSPTFVPADSSRSDDHRTLGVYVGAVRFVCQKTDTADDATHDR